MKPMKISGACIVIALVVAMTMAASAQASTAGQAPVGALFAPPSSFTTVTTLAPSTDPIPVAHASPPPFLNPTVSAEIDALVRQGIPPARASRAIDVQGEISETELIHAIEVALGGRYAGIWYIPETANLHVGVTSAAAGLSVEKIARQAKLEAHVTAKQVHSGFAELVAAQKRWNRRLAGLFDRAEVSTSVSPEKNSVNIKLGSAVPAEQRAELETQAAADSVNVLVSSVPVPKIRIIHEAGRCKEHVENKAYCDPTLVSGVTIEGEAEGRCTAGPTAILQDLTKETTETFLLTAGHCIEQEGGEGANWYSWDKKGEKKELIGKAFTYLEASRKDKVDVGVIKIEGAYWKQKGLTPVVPTIAQWSAVAETEPIGVPGQTETGTGKTTCISGGASGTRCGTVEEILVADQGVENLVEVSETQTAKGDSGAPWFSGTKETLPYMVEGTHVGKSSVTNNPIFHPVAYSFEQLIPKIDLQLLKGENEKRPACPMK